MISKHILYITFLNKSELLFVIQLNGFTYFYQTGIILFTINHKQFPKYHIDAQLGIMDRNLDWQTIINEGWLYYTVSQKEKGLISFLAILIWYEIIL